MGAERFDVFQKGSDAQEAFDTAQSAACYEHGHGGYTGTLAEKTCFELRADGEPFLLSEGEEFAQEDGDENSKWGPAFALAIYEDDPREIVGYLFYGWASS